MWFEPPANGELSEKQLKLLTTLIGGIIHLENYQSGDRKMKNTYETTRL